MDKIQLWPTEVYFFENHHINNSNLEKLILQKEKEKAGRNISNRGGWQSNAGLFEDSEFIEVQQYLIDCANKIVSEVCKEGTNIELVGSWANVNRRGHYNAAHIHHGSHYSCAYYVTQTHEASIFLCDPRIRKDMDSSSEFLKNSPLSQHYVEAADYRPGDAVFFPGWLEHGVRENYADSPRISISCDFVFR